MRARRLVRDADELSAMFQAPSTLRGQVRIDMPDRHFIVHYSSQLGADAPSWEYPLGDGYAKRPMQSQITVNNTEAYYAACLAGLGIAPMPRVTLDERFGAAQLVEVLPDLTSRPLPVSLVHPHGRNPPKRVAAVMSWMIQVLETRLRR